MEPSSQPGPCLSDEQAIALLEKRVDEAARQAIDAHLDQCDECRELVGALALTGAPEAESAPDIALEDLADEGSVTLLRSSAGGSSSRPSLPPGQGAPLDRGDMVDHFRVMRTLGRGAMGEVYLARDTLLGRKVALKIIAPDLLGSDKAVRRFLFEARATARFNHPNIVTIHAVGEHEGRPWVALEYVEGENLRERARREQPPLRETLRIGLAMAEALAQAHERGVLHRDLKPANVVIGTDGRIRIVDFGLAKAVQATEDDVEAGVHAISSSTWLVGTPRYMAPEQWEGSNVEGAADIWALGVILFELASGRRPFEADSTVELLRMVCSDRPAPRLASVASVPSKLSQLVGQCLAKEPADRPAAAEVAAALREVLMPTAPVIAEGPFRGLLPFGEAHASLFYGREPEVDAFLERLRRQTIIPVVGPSGVGKSSFVQAAVIPRLREQEGWLVLSLRPGPQPFDTLAARLERGEAAGASESAQLPTVAAVEARAKRLRESPRHLALELLDLSRSSGDKVLLFIDQLEELFTLVDVQEQQRFLDAIAHAADDLDDPVRVVLTIRHDFVDRLAAVGGAASPLARFFALKSPDRRMLEAAVRQPVERAGFAFEDDELVEQMIQAVQGEPACLALLQFAAERLWEERDEDRKLLVTSAYEAMGGVGGALARHADAQLNNLAPSQRRIATTLLQRLVTPERTRRLVPRDEALEGLGRDAESVLERLTEARLVSVIKLHRGEAPRVELTHGSLIHTWHTLATLVERGEDEHRLIEEASQAADLWAKRGRRPEELWRGQALRDAERHLSGTELPAPVMEFLRASDQNEQLRASHRRFIRIGSMATLAVVAAVAIVASLVIIEQRAEEEMAKQRALARATEAERLAATEAVSAARAALDRRDPTAARDHLIRALIADDHPGARLIWQEIAQTPLRARETHAASPTSAARATSPKRKSLAAGAELTLDEDGTLYRRDEDGERRPWRAGVRSVSSVPDAPEVAVVDDDGVVVLSTRSSRTVRALTAPPDTIRTIVTAAGQLAVLLDGALLAGRPERLRSLDVPHAVESIAFEDELLVVRGAGQRSWWDATRVPLLRPGHRGAPRGVASPRDGVVITVDGGGTWRRFDRAGLTREVGSGLGYPEASALAPDGETVAAVARGSLEVWSPAGAPRTLDAKSDARTLALGSRGHLAAASRDQVAVWDVERGRVTRTIAVGPTIDAVAIDGERLVIADSSGKVTPWTGADAGEPLRLPPSPVTALATRGASVAVARPDEVVVVDLASGRQQRLAMAGAVAVSIDAEGKVIVASGDGEVARFDPSDGRRVAGGIALMPDGSLITTRGRLEPPDSKEASSAEEARWLKAAKEKGLLGHQLEDGAPLCMLTVGGELAVWSTGADRLMGAHVVEGLRDVVGLPSACAVRSDGQVLLSSGGEPHALDVASPSAIGWAEQRLLVATGDAVTTFSESGDRLERHDLSQGNVSAVTQAGSKIVVGHGDGRLTWLETVDGSASSRAGASNRAVTALAAGPGQAIVAGYADGTVAIQVDDGSLAWRAELDGAVTHLRYEGATLTAATQNGDVGRWSFEGLEVERCALLAAVMTKTAAMASLEGRHRATSSLPEDHPCHGRAGP